MLTQGKAYGHYDYLNYRHISEKRLKDSRQKF